MAKTAAALRIAIELLHVPSRLRLVRSSPLPDDVYVLLRIAAGDAEAEAEAVAQTERSGEIVRAATVFFIEQVLLEPVADSYRALGANPLAPTTELRRNMALLLTWLHPDKNAQGSRAFLAERVTHAWNDLKTEERRAAYDRNRPLKTPSKSMTREGTARIVQHRAHPNQTDRARSSKLDRRDSNGTLRRFLSLFLRRADD